MNEAKMGSWRARALRVITAAACAYALVGLTADPSVAAASSETTGGVTNTWTDYTTASGTQGPSIPSNRTVDVTCRVQGFTVQDGNTWWYQIASAPWSNTYYASADAFYNNGQTSGSLSGTPFYDPGVPVCSAASGGSPPSPPTSSPSSGTASGETTGGITHTWSDYLTASGTQGPSIPANQTVQVTCRVAGFTVADGNTWWYQIASAPWSNSYYASADAFYNNGQTTGSLIGTPFVDTTVPTCPGSALPSAPPSLSETSGGITHTWSDYLTASGTQGPSIPANQTVQITCRVTGFQVADGNTWWYQIASAPWSNSYYASADAFYNNGQTTGSLTGTPFVDPAVPTCGSTGPAPPGIPLAAPSTPTIAQGANGTLVHGVVLVGAPPNPSPTAPGAPTPITKGAGFVRLTQVRRVPIGSQIDALRGTLELTVAIKRHATQTVRLSGGIFSISQVRSGLRQGLTTLTIRDGTTFPDAPSSKGCADVALAAQLPYSRTPKLSRRVLQTLNATDRSGKFRTVGHYSSATVRGTSWSTTDRCDGTFTKVERGIVDVLDFGLRKTITLRAGQSYLAGPGARKKAGMAASLDSGALTPFSVL